MLQYPHHGFHTARWRGKECGLHIRPAQNRQYVRLDGVSNIRKFCGAHSTVVSSFRCPSFLHVTHYLDVAEVVHQSRLPDFSSLVEQVSFGRQYQPVFFPCRREQHLFHPVQKVTGLCRSSCPSLTISFHAMHVPSPPVIGGLFNHAEHHAFQNRSHTCAGFHLCLEQLLRNGTRWLICFSVNHRIYAQTPENKPRFPKVSSASNATTSILSFIRCPFYCYWVYLLQI